ncbi:hypothetical protein SM033_00214 [Vibrio phage vB_VpaM_sm033]|nr:hypothetical protein SM033_00214 [Vibrio phage vB_VpaM_sm033]
MDKTSDDFGYELPKINETNFRKNYLPLLLNNDSPEGRSRWINEVAIVPSVRVNVVDDHDHDKILFWVPPVVYTPSTLEGTNMGQLIENAVVKAVTRHNTKILNDQINEFESVMDPATPPQEDIDQWEFILKHFGLLEGSTDQKVNKDDSNDTTVDYEEDEW